MRQNGPFIYYVLDQQIREGEIVAEGCLDSQPLGFIRITWFCGTIRYTIVFDLW